MNKEEWLKRCEAQFNKCVDGGKYDFRDAAEVCYDMHDDFPDDPEGAADTEMSYWDEDPA